VTKQDGSDWESSIEVATREIGQDLLSHLDRRAPSIFERRWWEDRILSRAMADESIKVQMFRFVDVLPMLRKHEAIASHLQEYFDEVRAHLPWAVRLGLDISQPNSVLGRALGLNAKSNVLRMASRFIAGSDVSEVLDSVRQLRRGGYAFTLDLLGEATISERESNDYLQAYLDLISELAPAVQHWTANEQLDFDDQDEIPRVNVSLKLSSLYSQFSPVDPAGTAQAVKQRLRPLLRSAAEHQAHLHVDMEQYSYKDLTLDIFKEVLLEDEFRGLRDVGIVVQTYLPDAADDLKGLLEWARQRGTSVCVRLVKGAYWDYEAVVAARNNWPLPVFRQKWQSDREFERQTRFLLENRQWLRPAFGSHNLRSLAHVVACARQLGVPESAYEIQLLYGMGMEQAQLFTEMGNRVRVYAPFGRLIPGMAYLVRRLLENTSNDSFLRQTYSSDLTSEELLMNPAEIGGDLPQDDETPCDGFQNEPHSDFSRAEIREAMQSAIDDVASQFNEEYSLLIDGRMIDSKGTIVSINPSCKSQVIGRVAAATPDDVTAAIDAARRALGHWSKTDVSHRAEYLELMAAEIRNHRFELAAWQIHECGKNCVEADADVAEAIDFCMYYADQMRQLAPARTSNVAGEDNHYLYRARGVAVVIAPWNFPLAIMVGMTAAALVAGNTVVMKPAEQSSIMAAKFMEIAIDAGLPDGVINFLPGVGEEIGPELVGSPDVDIIVFTGSVEVGLEINRLAAVTDARQRNVKRVIAEMGGKNAIIIDDDADLDEAVRGVVHSAFGYCGQKCSACSRVIVLEDIYDLFVGRLTEAVLSLKVGPAADPGTFVGPVIDEDAVERIQKYIEIGKQDTEPLVAIDVSELADSGHYVGPHVFGDVAEDSPLVTDEIFGPVLAVQRASSLDHALKLANATAYALTGGIYSRSPTNLERARREFLVGNLYLNREITGALVQRHPFGGFRMSGIGSKAGGPDYLLQFLVPINITENTLRRGFAPIAEAEIGE